ncbi:MAG: hypothetical protein U0Q16_18735 [Bryobacteraceae bacterium]
MSKVSGSFRLLYLYDVAEEIDLGELRKLVGSPEQQRNPTFRTLAPEYVRFERPPVVEPIEAVTLESGEKLHARLNYFEYGVISLELELPFAFDWHWLVQLSNRWVASPEVERQVIGRVKASAAKYRAAFVKPYETWLTEDYAIIQVNPQEGVPAATLISEHGPKIAQIVRGESTELSWPEQEEVLQSRLSYFPNDLVVAGWAAAFVYDTPEGAAPTIQLLQYANTQLLDFRHYDEVLTRVLADGYKLVERRRRWFSRWGLIREAERINRIALDVRELTERVDNSIKFLSDMFFARLYRLAAARVGVPDYRKLVDSKLHTAGELYSFLVDQFHHSRAFLLEFIVVVILIVDLIMLFRGK